MSSQPAPRLRQSDIDRRLEPVMINVMSVLVPLCQFLVVAIVIYVALSCEVLKLLLGKPRRRRRG